MKDKEDTRPLTDEELDEITAVAAPRAADDQIQSSDIHALVAELKARRQELEEVHLALRSALSESWEREGLEGLPAADLIRQMEKRLGASEQERDRLCSLIVRLHQSISEIAGAEELHAQLEREAVRLSVLQARSQIGDSTKQGLER